LQSTHANPGDTVPTKYDIVVPVVYETPGPGAIMGILIPLSIAAMIIVHWLSGDLGFIF
jgi:hypothetical protein